jgi:hypothetical protein
VPHSGYMRDANKCTVRSIVVNELDDKDNNVRRDMNDYIAVATESRACASGPLPLEDRKVS